MLRVLLLVAPLAAALALPAATGAGAVVEVAIVNFGYDPEVAEAHVGDTVRWTNLDSLEHTVTLEVLFDSGNMNVGDAYEHVFDVPGVFPYRCAYHPTMLAAVVVLP